MMGFDLRHPIDIVFDDLYRFIPGFVIGLAFFSDAIPQPNSEPGASPNGGPVAPVDNSSGTEGPPSVS